MQPRVGRVVANQPHERPEGERTSPRARTIWRVAREIIGLLLVWMVAVYVITRGRGDVATAAITLSVGCFVVMLFGYGVESAVMRKAPTLWIGCLALAAWGAWLPFAEPGAYLAVAGIACLAIVGITSGEGRRLSQQREREFLAAHDRWRRWRLRLRNVLAAGMATGLALAVFWGVWNSVALT